MRRLSGLVVLCVLGVPLAGTAASPIATDPCGQGGRALWVDRTHDWLSRGLCWPSRWVDGFFADPLSTNNEPAASLVRITGERTWRDDDLDDRDLDVDARVWLPSAERRLSLLFRSKDDDAEAGGPRAADIADTGEDDGGFRGALRWVINRTEAMDVDLDAGVRSDLTTFTRLRYRSVHPLFNEWAWLRFTERVEWRDPKGWRSRSLFEIDRAVSDIASVRLASQIEYSEELNEDGRGLGLFQGVNLFLRQGDKAAWNLGVGAAGFTKPEARVDSYRCYVHYRRQVWRPWLFVEVEPFVLWPRDQGYQGVNGITLRLETLFGRLDG